MAITKSQLQNILTRVNKMAGLNKKGLELVISMESAYYLEDIK